MTSEISLSRRQPAVDLLRFMLAVAVILYHSDLLPYGYLAVDSFFVLSGYYSIKIAQHHSQLSGYIWHRIKRLLPPLVFLISITAIYVFFVFGPFYYGQLFVNNIFHFGTLSSIFEMLNASYFDESGFRPLLNLWSISLEFFFILIFSFFLFKTQLNKLLVPLFLLSIIACLVFLQLSERLAFFSIFSRYWEFSAGVILYLFNLRRSSMLIVLAGLLFAVFSSWDWLFRAITVLATLYFIEYSRLCDQFFLNKYFTGAVRFLGYHSYEIYLFHFPVLYFFETHATVLFVMAMSVYITINRFLSMKHCFFIYLVALVPLSSFYLDFRSGASLISAGLENRSFRCGPMFKFLELKNRSFCRLNSNSGLKVLLLGDSRVDALKYGLIDGSRFEIYMPASNLNLTASDPVDFSEYEKFIIREDIDIILIHFSDIRSSLKLVTRLASDIGEASEVFALPPLVTFSADVPFALWSGWDQSITPDFVIPGSDLPKIFQTDGKVGVEPLKDAGITILGLECTDKEPCDAPVFNDEVLFFDTNHLSKAGSIYFGNKVVEAITNTTGESGVR